MPSEVTASMYEAAGSVGTAGITRDYQMVPRSDYPTDFNNVTLPAGYTIQERPSSVIINKTGIYKFLYTTTASIGGISVNEAYVSGSEVVNGGPVELPIQPVAWANAGTSAVGQVTFVYKGVK
tara:strand:+ start:676 stop:1044 length:369 start_codon:yes stop_codon:yes gene_type:complete